ncbi:MAG: hypothetical protein KGO81_01045 [Bacteroidota bacterium]|nr:hypothetical protein [Bacteroidota bacterium]
MRKLPLIILVCVLYFTNNLLAQENDSLHLLKINYLLSENRVQKLTRDYKTIKTSIINRTEESLHQLRLSEQKLEKKLSKKNSSEAKQLFSGTQQLYADLENRLKKTPNNWQKFIALEPQLDSIQNLSKFLAGTNSALNQIGSTKLRKISVLGNEANELENKLAISNEIRKILSSRKDQLENVLKKYSLFEPLKSFNKQVYYYQQSLLEYKSMLKDKKKMEEKVLSILRDQPLFVDFMKKNSLLAKLFPFPANYGNSLALQSLQTRDQIGAIVQQSLGVISNGSDQRSIMNPQQLILGQVQQLQGQVAQLGKQGLNSLNINNGTPESIDFKPNNQKVKTFWKRLDFGFNMQSTGQRYALPAISDLAISLGYKLNDNSIIGIGFSDKVGLGKSINDIHLSNQGVGFRSFLDIKIKNKIWLSGGYEVNYLPDINKVPLLMNCSPWQRSGLLGVTKKLKAGKKETKMQVLWDFLSYNQIPHNQPIVFRIGFGF